MIRLALTLGAVQAWFACGYRQGTALERALILPTWAVVRVLFLGSYRLAVRKLKTAAAAD